MSCFFVTGTDTNVGKTICSRAIIQALQHVSIQVVGYKPIACGQEEPVYTDISSVHKDDYATEDNFDVLTLLNATNEKVSYRDINSYTFTNSSPMLTNQREFIHIDKINRDLDKLNSLYQTVLVEGSFGWLTPLNEKYTFADWVMMRNMPVVLVVGIKEGCINHALLTVQSITRMGLPLLGWIANRINPGLAHYAEIIALLSHYIEAPLLGQIPYIHKPEEQELGRFITDIDRLRYMQTIHERVQKCG